MKDLFENMDDYQQKLQKSLAELQKQEYLSFIENQKQQIELANKLIEHANGNEEIIRFANEFIKSCEKCISIEERLAHILHCPKCKETFQYHEGELVDKVWVKCPYCKTKIY